MKRTRGGENTGLIKNRFIFSLFVSQFLSVINIFAAAPVMTRRFLWRRRVQAGPSLLNLQQKQISKGLSQMFGIFISIILLSEH